MYQQVSNVMDLVLAILMLGVFGVLNWLLSRKLGVSKWPSLGLLPILFIIGVTFHHPNSPWFIPSDGEYYTAWADSIRTAVLGGEPEIVRRIWPGKGVWSSVLALLQFAVGTSNFSTIGLSSAACTASVLATQKSSQNLIGKTGSWPVLILFSSFGGFLIFGPSLLRESFFWLGVSLGVLGLSEIKLGRVRASIIFSAISSFFMIGIRPDFGIILALCFLAISLALSALHSTKVLKGRGLPFAVGFGFLAVLAYPSFLFLTQDSHPAENLSNVATKLSGEEITSSFGPPNPQPLPQATLMRLSNVLFGPFLYEFDGAAVWLLATLATLHFWGVFAFALVHVVTVRGRLSIELSLLFIALLSIGIFAIILTNYGILVRFKVVPVLLLAPMALAGWQSVIDTIKPRFIKGRKFRPPNPL